MSSLSEKGGAVNPQEAGERSERKVQMVLIYIIIFLFILLVVGLYELKRIRPVQRPFHVEGGTSR